jgi:phage-related protein
MGRDIIFYKTGDGKCPVEAFLDSLPSKAAQKAVWVLSLAEDMDIVPSSYLKKMAGSDDIWEFRFQYGSNAYRIFCFFAGKSIVVLTHGLIKKTQKTPRKEIERAEAYKQDFLKRRKAK